MAVGSEVNVLLSSAGSAPGNHITLLSQMFPAHHFILVDPVTQIERRREREQGEETQGRELRSSQDKRRICTVGHNLCDV